MIINTVHDICASCAMLTYLESNDNSPELEDIADAHICLVGEDITESCKKYLPLNMLDDKTIAFLLTGE